MFSSHSYPIFLSLAGKACLVAGLGAVGARKLAGLLKTDAAAILALDLRPAADLSQSVRALLADDRVHFAARACASQDIAQSFMVFAATGDAVENRRIAEMCQRAGVLCNCVTKPQAGDFILPACAQSGSLRACISTGGASPILARQWRGELLAWLEPKAELARLMGQLRSLILEQNLACGENAKLFARVAKALEAALAEGIRIDNPVEWFKNNWHDLRGKGKIKDSMDG